MLFHGVSASCSERFDVLAIGGRGHDFSLIFYAFFQVFMLDVERPGRIEPAARLSLR